MPITNRTGTISATATVDQSNVAPITLGHSKSSIYDGSNLFLNLAKSHYFAYSDYNRYDDAYLDANGYPTEIPSGSTHIKVYLYAVAGAGSPGNYAVSWECDDDLTLTGALGSTISNVAYSDGVGSADLSLPSTGELRFALSGGGAGSVNNFRNLKVIPKATFSNWGGKTGVQLDAEGMSWHPDYIDRWTIPDQNGRANRRVFCARYMDLNDVNFLTDVRDVADIKTKSHADWKNEMPPELAVEFAQLVRPVYSWWCFPNRSTDAYQQAVMTTLKGMIGYSTPVFERANEDWNFLFSSTLASVADSVEYFAVQGATGFSTSSGVSITSGNTTFTVGAGEGANFTVDDAVSIGGLYSKVASVSTDTVTVDRTSGVPDTGTYDVHTGSHTARLNWHSKETYRIQQNAAAVFDNRSDYKIPLAAQGGAGVSADYFETPLWLEVDPARPETVSFCDWYSISSYYGSSDGLTEAMVATWQTDEAQALSDFHDQQLVVIEEMGASRASARDALDAYSTTMPIVPYEGDTHSLHSAAGAGWTTYDVSDAVPLVEAWLDDEAMQEEATNAVWQAQQGAFASACVYLIIDTATETGSWGLYPSQLVDNAHGTTIAGKAGLSVAASFVQRTL